jgi:hypothetical protein
MHHCLHACLHKYQVQLTRRVEDLRKEVEQLSKASKKDAEALRKKLRATHKAELEQLLAEQLAETEAMHAEFQRVQAVMQEQTDLLEKRLAESQDLYARRTSRPEDLERVAQLQAENAQLADEVAKLVKDMKYYKLELLNREKNFNKLFNAAPNVGVMSVLKTGGANAGPQLGASPNGNNGNNGSERSRSARR